MDLFHEIGLLHQIVDLQTDTGQRQYDFIESRRSGFHQQNGIDSVPRLLSETVDLRRGVSFRKTLIAGLSLTGIA